MTLVVGIGNPDRGDDGAGPAVADRVAALGLAGVRVVTCAAPTRLIELWDGEPDVVVVDAVRADPDGRAGLLVVEAGDRMLETWPARGGTHGFGLAAAIELARSLGRLPAQLRVIGVPGHRFGHGEPFSPMASCAVEEAVRVAVVLACPPGDHGAAVGLRGAGPTGTP